MARRRISSRRSGGFRIAPAAIAAALLLFGALAVLVYVRNDPGLEIADDGVGVAAGGLNEAAGSAGGFFTRLGALWDATDRVRRLEAEKAELEQWRAYALALAERNARYETLLKMPPDAFGAALQPGKGVSARLLLDAGGPFRRTVLANAGANQGVRRGFVALNEHGLVGRVVSVGQSSARILLLDDYNSRVPVMGLTSRTRAVMVGAASSVAWLEGPIGAQTANLDFVVGALRPGETLVTSGDGGIYPGGVVVGVVMGQNSDKRWRARLATAAAPIDYVRIIPYAPPTAPEDAPVADAGPPAVEVIPRALTDAGPVQAGAFVPTINIPPPDSAAAPAAAAPKPRPPPPKPAEEEDDAVVQPDVQANPQP